MGSVLGCHAVCTGSIPTGSNLFLSRSVERNAGIRTWGSWVRKCECYHCAMLPPLPHLRKSLTLISKFDFLVIIWTGPCDSLSATESTKLLPRPLSEVTFEAVSRLVRECPGVGYGSVSDKLRNPPTKSGSRISAESDLVTRFFPGRFLPLKSSFSLQENI